MRIRADGSTSAPETGEAPQARRRFDEREEQTVKGRILIVDDDEMVLAGLSALMEELGWEITPASSGREALVAFARVDPDVVLLDVQLPDLSGTEVLEQLKAYSETTPVVMMSGAGTIDIAVRAMRLGAENFVSKPCDSETLELALEQAALMVSARREIAALRRHSGQETLVGISPAIHAINEMIERVANAPSPVLLQGESGTGKGLVARLIHERSRRAAAPYVDLNCAGLSRELLESELFGHEKGAFTGAVSSKAGLFEMAHGGTLFLDEIGELELSLQARLLKAIEEKRFRRVGGVRDIRVEVRLIAATNRDLALEVAEKRFRADLFFRLNVVQLIIPPLRQRRDDIPILVDVLLRRIARDFGRATAPRLSDRAAQKLTTYGWSGNVRELRNVLERAMLVTSDDIIQADHLLLDPPPSTQGQSTDGAPQDESEIRPLDEVISHYIAASLKATGGNARRAAKLLNISPSTLYARTRK